MGSRGALRRYPPGPWPWPAGTSLDRRSRGVRSSGSESRVAGQQTGKEPLAFDQRLTPQIPPIKVQKVKSEEQRVASRPSRERLLQGAKIGNANPVLHD